MPSSAGPNDRHHNVSDFEAFARAYGAGRAQLLHTRLVADLETPVSAYLKLRGDGPSFLLESAEQGQRFGRWSFLGFSPRTVIRLEEGRMTIGGEERDAGDPYAAVAAELERYRVAPVDGLPTESDLRRRHEGRRIDIEQRDPAAGQAECPAIDPGG